MLTSFRSVETSANRFGTIMASSEAKDVWIFTAKQKELDVVSKKIRSHYQNIKITEKYEPNEQITCYHGTLLTHGKNLVKFVLASCAKQGPQAFAVFASRMLTKYPSEYALMVGICAGYEKEMNLCDVVFACESFNCDEGKKTLETKKGNNSEEFYPLYTTFKAETGVADQVTAFLHSEERDYYKQASMVTSSSVQENAKPVFERVRAGANKNVSALDMESSAFFQACCSCNVKALPVIKAVSDVGDKNKDDSQHEKALQRAARAAIDFMGYYFDEVVSAGLNPQERSGSQLPVHKGKVQKTDDSCGGNEVAAPAAEDNSSGKVTDKLLFELSKQIRSTWVDLAYRLGFDLYNVEGIKDEMRNSNKQERAFRMLQQWKRDDGNKKGATKKVLAEALRGANLSESAKFVLSYET